MGRALENRASKRHPPASVNIGNGRSGRSLHAQEAMLVAIYRAAYGIRPLRHRPRRLSKPRTNIEAAARADRDGMPGKPAATVPLARVALRNSGGYRRARGAPAVIIGNCERPGSEAARNCSVKDRDRDGSYSVIFKRQVGKTFLIRRPAMLDVVLSPDERARPDTVRAPEPRLIDGLKPRGMRRQVMSGSASVRRWAET